MGFGNATKYEIVHIKKGGMLNVREAPSLRKSAVIGRLAAYTTGIRVKECMELTNGEWCYINVPRGGSHLEGWVNSYYLAPMTKRSNASRLHISNFLHNFYLADEENFLDKLQVFYSFPMQKYLYSKNISLMDLRQKKVRFYKKWPKRDYRLTYMKILKRKSNYIDVQTTVRWKVQGGDDYDMGKDIQKLRLIPTGNTFKVSALKYLKHTVYPKPEPIVDENLTEVELLTIDEEGNLLEDDASMVENTTLPASTVYIKAGSFFSDINKDYLASISSNGFPYIIQKVYQGDKLIRRVFIGPFESRVLAEESLEMVQAKINKYAYIQSSINK
jgi:hypothetical protein